MQTMLLSAKRQIGVLMGRIFELEGAKLPAAKGSTAWGGLPGASRSLAIAEACRNVQQPIVVVARNDTDATAVQNELRFFMGEDKRDILYLPSTETLPYDLESPPGSITSSRHAVLHKIATSPNDTIILVLSVSTLLSRIAEPEFWRSMCLTVRAGMEIDIDTMAAELIALGYQRVTTARERGEFTINNSVFDIVPMGYRNPLRLRVADGVVLEMSAFNVNSQRSGLKVEQAEIMATREIPISRDARDRFRVQWRNYFDGKRTDPIHDAVVFGDDLPSGAESYLPFFVETSSVLEFLPKSTSIFLLDGAMSAARSFWSALDARYSDVLADTSRQVIRPDLLWMSEDWLKASVGSHSHVLVSNDPVDSGENFEGELTGISRSGTIEDIMETMGPWCEGAGYIIYCMHSDTRREEMAILSEMLGQEAQWIDGWDQFGSDGRDVAIAVAEIDEGFYLAEADLLVVTEKEIFGQTIFQKSPEDEDSQSDYQRIRDLSILEIGSALVHLKYGVGRFDGLEVVDLDGITREFLAIKYAESGKILVKMTDLDLVNRYSGLNMDDIPIDRASSEKWSAKVAGALRDIKATARALLAIHAQKSIGNGIQIPEPDARFVKFSAEFPFQETRDQRTAIESIVEDLCKKTVMDRVVCGDVGFGKTEVAMRAAFLTVAGGYQVAVMVPTTLLAQQHYDTFKRRFSSFGIQIRLLTRHTEGKSEKEALAGLRTGEVQIVIGTHRLIQGDIKYQNLGLFVVDEEHRFGVRQKELITNMRGTVNMLSLTATPIPRTLSLSLHGVRDLSVISTPPAKRLSIRTYVVEQTDSSIREAIRRELMRQGQIFYVHNRIESIEEAAERAQSLAPEARIRVAHGQMDDGQLELIMAAFYRKEFDILVCTTIIETGIDVPNANTIIIESADHFGLAQLHQLRGRVGRSQRQAYAYLVLSESTTSDAGQRRLDAMRKATSLGDGYLLANHDLEIRGAGEILGEAQSGQIQLIGFQMYMALLEREIRLLQGGDGSVELDIGDVHLEVNIDGLIPQGFVSDPSLRLALYKRIASAASDEEIENICAEIQDRFGDIPPIVQPLFDMARLKEYQRSNGIRRLIAGTDGARLEIDGERPALKARLDALCETLPEQWLIHKATGGYQWVHELPEGQDRIAALKNLIDLVVI